MPLAVFTPLDWVCVFLTFLDFRLYMFSFTMILKAPSLDHLPINVQNLSDHDHKCGGHSGGAIG